jgi:hypothetical protein
LEVCLADATQQIQELKVLYDSLLNLNDQNISIRHYSIMVRISASYLKLGQLSHSLPAI